MCFPAYGNVVPYAGSDALWSPEPSGRVATTMTSAPNVYTHGHHESVLRSHRWRTAENSAAYLLPHLAPGASLLDVGSGPGTITVDLADRVSPGHVTALEATEAAIALTRA